MPYRERDFIASTNENLRWLWDRMFEDSFHVKQTKPTLTDQVYRRLVERLFQKWTLPKPGDWILKLDMYNEATCTKYGYYFMTRGVDVAYVDISRFIIRSACYRMRKDRVYSKAHPVLADFRALPFRENCFTASCSFGSVEHVPQWQKCMYEQEEVTRPGGCLIVGVPNIQNIWMRYWSCKLLDRIGLLSRFTSYELHFTPGQIRSIMTEMGLLDIEVTGYHLFPKQLRWLDLWIQQYPNRSIAKARDFFFRPMLIFFENLEKRSTRLNLLAEMIIAKGVKPARSETVEDILTEPINRVNSAMKATVANL